MRKKQLLLQSTSLFAEIERKSSEIESLKLRTEELIDKLENLTAQNAALERTITNKDDELLELKKHNDLLQEELEHTKDLLAIAKEKLNAIPAPAQTAIDDTSSFTSADAEDLLPIAEERVPTNNNTESQKSLPITENPRTFTPMNDMLRDYGAQIIGKVTRITACTIAKIQQNGGDAAESLQTLALGKNESFKFQVLSLLESGKEHADIRKEMDSLAEEAIAYLESI